jgi:hypothetical protein
MRLSSGCLFLLKPPIVVLVLSKWNLAPPSPLLLAACPPRSGPLCKCVLLLYCIEGASIVCITRVVAVVVIVVVVGRTPRRCGRKLGRALVVE